MPKLSAALRRVKARVGSLRTVALGLAVSLCGCGTIVARDRSPSRPDTVTPANLLGPYEGQVLERETRKPISGALVVGSFGFSRGAGFRAPAGASVVESKTDEDGRYRIEAPLELPTGPSVRLDRFTLIVYRRGFVAYRSDRELVGSEVRARQDFSQRSNEILMTKLDPAVGHERHLRFLGVWGAPKTLADAIAWEFEAARGGVPSDAGSPNEEAADPEAPPTPEQAGAPEQEPDSVQESQDSEIPEQNDEGDEGGEGESEP